MTVSKGYSEKLEQCNYDCYQKTDKNSKNINSE